MSARRMRAALAVIFGLGAVARLIAWRTEPPIFPDEFFQYLEPAWIRLSGAGIEAWEWRDGVRSWVLPGYHGGWMALMRLLGLSGAAIGQALQLHWALVSLVLVWAGWRGGCALARTIPASEAPRGTDTHAPPDGWQGGLLGASLCATFPLLVRFSTHTFSEVPSMLALVVALVLTGDAVVAPKGAGKRQAALAGLLASLGVCLRVANGPLAIVPVLWILARWRPRLLLPLVSGALAPVLLFGLVDLVTWGGFLSSFVAYVKFNFLKQGASRWGRVPAAWYLGQMTHRLPIGLALLVVPALAGLRVTWPYLLSAAGLLGYLSTQPHKEERFIILVWPLLLIAAAGAVGRVLARRWPAPAPETRASATRRRIALAAVALGVVVVIGDGLWHSGHPRAQGTGKRPPKRENSRSVLAGQAWVGAQADATGLLIEDIIHNGGYLWLGRPIPMAYLQPPLIDNQLFNYALVRRGSVEDDTIRSAGFLPVFWHGNHVVYRRAERAAAAVKAGSSRPSTPPQAVDAGPPAGGRSSRRARDGSTAP